jgi:hypothetical protein
MMSSRLTAGWCGRSPVDHLEEPDEGREGRGEFNVLLMRLTAIR